MYGMTRPSHVSKMPSVRHRLNIGFTSEIWGKIAIRRADPMSARLPGKSSLAMA